MGSNERIHVAIIGLNGRGPSMADFFAKQPDLEITTVCDVDSRTIPKVINIISEAGQAMLPKRNGDCRRCGNRFYIEDLVVCFKIERIAQYIPRIF